MKKIEWKKMWKEVKGMSLEKIVKSPKLWVALSFIPCITLFYFGCWIIIGIKKIKEGVL